MTLPAHPIPNSYWVSPGRFLAGGYPGDLSGDEARGKVRRLLAAGVSFFLDLTEEGELNPYAPLVQDETAGRTIVHRRMSIGDFSIPTLEAMAAILDTIDAALAAGHCLYLHCWGGSGRTGTVVGCYLVRQGMSGEDALQEITRLRQGVASLRRSPETEEQREMVRRWSSQTEKSTP
jgi:protein-tyrosine phosphatase